MAQRRKFVAGNWKMNLLPDEGVALARELREALGALDAVDVAVAPTAVSLAGIGEALRGSRIALAGQNCHWEAAGAFTGELSAAMLKAVGVRHVIVGHSERRQLFGDSDESVNRKAKAVLAQGLTAIVCVGETLAERDGGATLRVVERQVEVGLGGLTAEQLRQVVIAYEPVWAIGTGRTATSAQAQEVHAHIRQVLERRFGRPAANALCIQYGGSVKPDNAAELMHQPDVDGALVGGASLKAKDFIAIVRAAAT